MPETSYFRGYDDGTQKVPTGMVELVTPPYSSLLFENTSEGVEGTPQWSINNTAGYPSTEPGYGTPTGDATPVEGTEDGNYIYEVQSSQGAGVEDEDFYRFPILSYGDQSYDLSNLNSALGGTQAYYTRAGIRATNEPTVLSLSAVGFTYPYSGFVTKEFGGWDRSFSYPQGYSNTTAGAQSNITNLCDDDESTFYSVFGVVKVGDFFMVDCGEVAERGNVQIVFADEDWLLNGEATIYVGETAKQEEMTVVGQYSPEKVVGNVYECEVDGEKVTASGRYIVMQVTSVPEGSPRPPRIAEIKADNMRFFSAPGVETVTHNFPEYTSSYGDGMGGRTLANLQDDDPATIFHSGRAQSVGDYILIDCGESVPRNEIVFSNDVTAWGEVENGTDAPGKVAIEISNDASEWTTVKEITDDELAAMGYTCTIPLDGAEVRYVRMNLLERNNAWLLISEFKVDNMREFTSTEERPLEGVDVMPTILTYYPKPADPFYLDHITMYATATPWSETNSMLPAGQELKVAVLEVVRDEEGHREFGDTIAKTTISQSNLRIPWQDAGGLETYAMEAEFWTTPDGIGVPERTSILLDSEYAVVVYDLDKIPGINISFMWVKEAGYSREEYGRASFTQSGSDVVANFGEYTYPWQLHGHYITMRPAEEYTAEAIACPTTGGVAVENGAFYSSVDTETIEIVAPDWADIEFGEMPEGDIKTTFTITVDANETGEDRDGEIVLTSPEGVTCTLALHQSGESSGVGSFEEKAISVVKSGEDFVVSYPETAGSVMVYNAAGMVVANYELPAGGQFVIPGSDFGPGMYIVKVYGENVVKTVKVIK